MQEILKIAFQFRCSNLLFKRSGSSKTSQPGIPIGVHSPFVWGGNGKIYLNEKYQKFDPERISQYPKLISEWGLPQVMYNGKMEGFISSREAVLAV